MTTLELLISKEPHYLNVLETLELETKVGDKMEKLRADCDRLKALSSEALGCSESVTCISNELENLRDYYDRAIFDQDRMEAQFFSWVEKISYKLLRILKESSILISQLTRSIEMCLQKLISLIIKEGEHLCVGGRRVVDAIVVSTVILLSFVYLYLIGFIDRGGSKIGSSGSLDFRDIYISIDLFQAAYVWIKFRDVIPRGAVYKRPNSEKFETRIKFPRIRGVGGESKRIRLGSFDTRPEAEYVYQIAAFYCKKHMYRLGRLNLGGGAYYFIPPLSVDRNLPYDEQVNQVGDQVLRVYAEFVEEWKASQNLPPHVPSLALERPTGEGELLTTSPIQQPQEPLNSQMDFVMQGQGSQPAPNIHNGVDFNNPSSAVLAKTQYELLETRKENENLKAQLSQLKQRNSELEGLLEQSRIPELDFDPDTFFDGIEA